MASHFDLYSALMSLKQGRFFSVPHLLWQRTSVYNGHLGGSVTLTAVAEHLAVELPLPVLGLSRLGFKNPTFSMRDERFVRLRHRGGSIFVPNYEMGYVLIIQRARKSQTNALQYTYLRHKKYV